MVVAKPHSINPHHRCIVYVLKKEEGGRSYAFFQWLSAAVLCSDHGCDRVVKLPKGVEMVMPGDSAIFEVELITPVVVQQGLLVFVYLCKKGYCTTCARLQNMQNVGYHNVSVQKV